MFLSRIMLDAAKPKTMLALASPNLFHGAIEKAFPGERKRKLWRIDMLHGQRCLLILSEEAVDLSTVCAQFSYPGSNAETKCYDSLLNRITNGSKWHFRLTANPVKSQKKENSRGKVQAHITTAYQKEWLLTHCEQHGFQLSEDSFDVTQSRWYQFYKSDQNRVSLLAVTFEGMLTVTDEELFRQALCAGIGRGKAYGMGMLTVMHI